MPELAIYVENKKYMWDNEEYASGDEAKTKAEEYRKDGFTVKDLQEDQKTYLYTRREVTEVVVDGQPSA